MPDIDLNARIQIHAYAQTIGYGLLLMVLGIWLIIRGLRERPIARKRRFFIPILRGRIVLGLFLIFAAFPHVDFGLNRLLIDDADRRVEANNDWNTIIPIVFGLIFAVWSFVRFWNNDINDRPDERVDRVADAEERIASATEQIAEQGRGE